MLSKSELTANINTEWEISLDYLKESRYGLCKYINDICISIRESADVASLAMVFTNYFFVKKCYLNYEKLTLACAAILLASKQENVQNKFNEISREYFQYNSKIFGQNETVFTSEVNQKIKIRIADYEVALLKALNFNLNIVLPFDYIYVYSSILYPDNENDIITTSISVAHDSFFTYANNVYKFYVVAIACIVIAAKILEIPTVIDKDFKYLRNMKSINISGISIEEFEKRLIQFENKGVGQETLNQEDPYFDSLTVAQKIHPKMKLEDLIECVEMILEFYKDAKKKTEASGIKSNTFSNNKAASGAGN